MALLPESGNINELPEGFFSSAPDAGSVDQLPSDFFSEPIEQEEHPTLKVFDENTSKTIEIPSHYDDKEVEYSATVAGANKNPNNFIGMTEMPEDEGVLGHLFTGVKSGFAQAPQIMGGILKEIAENQKRALANDPIRGIATQGLAVEDELNPLPANAAMQRVATDMIANNKAMMERNGLLRPEAGGLDAFVFDVGQGSTSLLTALGLTAVTKSTVPATVLFGTIQNSSVYIEATEAGMKPSDAAHVAGLAGTVEGALEIVGIDRFIKIGAGDKIIKKVIKRSLVEALQEGSQTAAEEAITNITGVRDTSLMEAAEDVAYSALLGGVIGAPVATVMSLSEKRAKTAGLKKVEIEAIKAAVVASEAVPRMTMLIEKENSPIGAPPKAEAERAQNITKAIAESGVESAITRETEAVQFIKDQMSDEQQRILGDVQAETDDIEVSLLRDIEEIQSTSVIEDEETATLLEQTAEALKIKRAIKKPLGLTEFVQLNEGISNFREDLMAIGVGKNKRTIINEGGITLDEMGERAVQAGFFEERPSEAEFLNAFSQDFDGNKVFSALDIGDAQQLEELDTLLLNLDQALSEQGISFTREALKVARERVAVNKKLNRQILTKEKKAASSTKRLAEKKKKVEEKPTRIFADKLKTFVAGIKKGKQLAKTEIKDAQAQIVKLLDSSGLQAEDKAKFISTIKNIQTADQLVKKLDDIQARVSELLEREARRKLRGQLKKELSAIKITKQSGKPRGKFTPEIQEALDLIRNIFKLSKGDAAAQLEESLSKIEGFPTAQEALENRVLALVADGASAPIDELNDLLKDVRSLKETGKLANKESLLAKRERNAILKDGVIDVVTEGENINIQDNTSLNGRIKKIKRNTSAFFVGKSYGWFDTLDVVLGKMRRGRRLRDDLQITELLQDAKGTVLALSEKLANAAENASGVKGKALIKKFEQDSDTNVELAKRRFINTAGVEVRLEYTVAQARKLWMEFQDPTLIEGLTRKLTKEEFRDGKGNGITPEMKEAIFELLDAKEKQFAREQMKIYHEFYPKINEVYSRVYGVNLPKNEAYSPISRQVKNESTVDEFLKESGHRRSVSAGSLKSRVASTLALKKSSDIAVFQRHVVEMSHFIHLAEKVQELNGLFGNVGVRKSIEAKNGKYMLGVIDGYLADFTRGGVRSSVGIEKIVDYLNGAFATSVLAAKPVLAAKQIVSFIALADSMPIKDFVAGMADFAKNRKKVIALMSETNLMRGRGSSVEQEQAQAGKEVLFKGLRHNARINEFLLSFVRMGDRGGIYLGGWPVIKHALDQGKTLDQAIRVFETKVSSTQQSRDIDQQSELQRGGALARTMTMFMSAPNAYLRAEMRAIRQIRRKEITKEEFYKKIAIYHFILPSLFQFVSDGFEWEGDHQLRVGLLGSFNGVFVLGDLAANALASLTGEYFWGDRSIVSSLEEIEKGIVSAIKSSDMEDLLESLQEIAEGVGTFTGKPVKQVFNAATGVVEIVEGTQTNDGREVLTGAKRVLGWSAGSVE